MARAMIDTQGLEELAGSIKAVGLIFPLVVKEVEHGFEVVDGHRRLLACRLAGVPVVPCLVRNPKEADPTAVKLHANLYRQEMSPVEEAVYFRELLPDAGNDTDELAKLVRQSRAYVEARLNLLNGDPEVLQAIVNREVSLGVGQELNKIKREKDRRYYLRWARETGATIATVRQWRASADAQAEYNPEDAPPAAAASPAPSVESAPITCVACSQFEPAADVRFRYLHEGCRRRLELALKRLGLDGDMPLISSLEYLAAYVEQRNKPEVKA